MRIAVVSDIHGNLTAFEAVLADLKRVSPDLILHGGDLADGGARPAEIVDRIRDLGWHGVVGNVDEMLFRPESLEEFAEQTPAMRPLVATIAEMAAATRDTLGSERLEWLEALPRTQSHGSMALVHASPDSLWRAPAPEASDAELEEVYGQSDHAHSDHTIAVYCHIHRPYIRKVPATTVVNSGSVSLSYDGDVRASYLLLDGNEPIIRRVAYDLDRELKALADSGRPHANWIAKMLASGSPQMP